MIYLYHQSFIGLFSLYEMKIYSKKSFPLKFSSLTSNSSTKLNGTKALIIRQFSMVSKTATYLENLCCYSMRNYIPAGRCIRLLILKSRQKTFCFTHYTELVYLLHVCHIISLSAFSCTLSKCCISH